MLEGVALETTWIVLGKVGVFTSDFNYPLNFLGLLFNIGCAECLTA